MALKVGELTAFINGDNKGLSSTLKDSESDMHRAGANIGRAAMGAATVVAGAGIAIGVASLKLSADFDASARKVSTIADDLILDLGQIKEGSLDLSNSMGIDANEINEALYQMISATGDTAAAFDMVEIAAKAAKGGFTDTVTAVDGLTSVVNAYGQIGADAMQKVSDQMLIAQNVGKTSFGEMASSIGKVAPIANGLKVSTDELFTSVAILTKGGLKTAEAITGLKAAYSNIIKPTSDAEKAAEGLALEFTAAHLAQVGWAEFLDEVADATGGNTEMMAQLFGSVEALNAMMILTSEEGGRVFDETIIQMGDSAGATQAAFETMDEGLSDTLNDTMNHFKNTGIVIGEQLAPKVDDLIGKLDDLVAGFSDLTEEQQSNAIDTGIWITGISIGVLVVGGLARALSAIGIFLAPLAGMFTTMGTALGGITAVALFEVAAGLAAIAAAAWVIPRLISDMELMGDEEGFNALDDYLDNPGQWKQDQRDIAEWKRQTGHFGAVYGDDIEARNVERQEDKRDLLDSALSNYFLDFKRNNLDPEPNLSADKRFDRSYEARGRRGDINIDIHDNTISDNMDLDILGDEFINRLNHAGVTDR